MMPSRVCWCKHFCVSAVLAIEPSGISFPQGKGNFFPDLKQEPARVPSEWTAIDTWPLSYKPFPSAQYAHTELNCTVVCK